jgi:hypothetical protein
MGAEAVEELLKRIDLDALSLTFVTKLTTNLLNKEELKH